MSENKYESVKLEHISCIPFDPAAPSYMGWGQYIPHTYTNWREETLSWKKFCYIHANLSCFPTLTITGPDTIKFISDISVNSYKNFPVGSCKHMIQCSPKGNIMDHGLILRTGENEVVSYVTPFYMMYLAEKEKYDINIESSTPENRAWVFQLAGPRSLEIVEHAIQEDIHDLKFMRFSYHKIAGRDVRILRMGMGGSLSYEVHGFTDEAGIGVYNELIRVGREFGLVKLGVNQYMCNHTENGFPQGTFHFPGAILDDPGYVEYMKTTEFYYDDSGAIPRGSLSTDIRDYYRHPLEVDWGHMVKFDHEFVGREALEKIAANNPRKMVTLVWNPEDIMKVFASFYEKGEEPYMDIPFPQEFGMMGAAENNFFQNKVLKDGKPVGVSMWRTYTLYYRDTISLCCIDAEFAKIGTEVSLVWGDIGQRQIEIRARVERFPYLDLTPNKDFDVEAIPHFEKK